MFTMLFSCVNKAQQNQIYNIIKNTIMRKIKIYLGMLVVATLTITSCQTDTVAEQTSIEENVEISKRTAAEETVVVKHVYTYGREEFTVNYTLDSETEEVISVDGDVARAEELFSTDEQASSILVTDLEEYNEDAPVQVIGSQVIKIQLFDSEVEMEAFVAADGGAIPAPEGEYIAGAEGPCSDFDIGGQGRFYFYANEYYSSEISNLRRYNRLYFRNHDVITAPNYNSGVSSLIVIKPYDQRSYTVLYEHSCFNGRRLAFYQGRGSFGFGIPRLSRYILNRWFLTITWSNQTDAIKGFAW